MLFLSEFMIIFSTVAVIEFMVFRMMTCNRPVVLVEVKHVFVTNDNH